MLLWIRLNVAYSCSHDLDSVFAFRDTLPGKRSTVVLPSAGDTSEKALWAMPPWGHQHRVARPQLQGTALCSLWVRGALWATCLRVWAQRTHRERSRALCAGHGAWSRRTASAESE